MNSTEDKVNIYDPDLIDVYLLLPILAVGMTVSTFFWKSLYILLKHYNRYPRDVVLHICPLVHTILSMLAITVFGNIHRNVFNTSALNNWAQNVILLFSTGFYIFESIFWQYEDHRDIVTLVHHTASIISFVYPLVTGTYASLCFQLFSIYESTNVFLNLRYLMKKYGFDKTSKRIFTLNDFCFEFNFIIQRFFLGIHYSYLILTDEIVKTEIKAMSVVWNVLSFAFFDAFYVRVKISI